MKDSLLEAACKELGYSYSKKDKWTSEKTTELIKLREQIKTNRDNIQDDTSVERSITTEYYIINTMVKKKSAKIDKNDWIDNITKETE